MDEMTLEEAADAIQRYSGPCACMGGPRCCVVLTRQAKEVLAEAGAAKSVVSQLAERLSCQS